MLCLHEDANRLHLGRVSPTLACWGKERLDDPSGADTHRTISAVPLFDARAAHDAEELRKQVRAHPTGYPRRLSHC